MKFRIVGRGFIGLCLALVSSSCATTVSSHQRYLFYLHGAIIERQGPNAVSDRFGSYDYAGILAKFRQSGLEVVSEIRPRGTDVSPYADKVAADVGALLKRGVPASHITVVGASKGSVIAALVSARLRNPEIRYVLLAACNDWLIEKFDPRLTGEVLSIYEQSDELTGSCRAVAQRSSGLARFEEIRLETGLAHGFLYRPLAEWMTPAGRWAKR